MKKNNSYSNINEQWAKVNKGEKGVRREKEKYYETSKAKK